MTSCWLLDHALVDSCGTLVPLKTYVRLRDCSGPIDAHHVIKQQRLRKEFPLGAVYDYHERPPRLIPAVAMWTNGGVDIDVSLDEILGHSANLVPACRYHHDLFHRGRLRVTRASLPALAEMFAEKFGLEWWLDHIYGELETEAA